MADINAMTDEDEMFNRAACLIQAVLCCGPAADADHVVNVAEKFRTYIKDGKSDNNGRLSADGSGLAEDRGINQYGGTDY